MKKEWNAPNMDELKISMTANGTANTMEPDSPSYQDPADGLWKVKLGNSNLSS